MTKIGLRKIILRIAKTTSKSLFIVFQDMLKKSRVLLPLHKKTLVTKSKKKTLMFYRCIVLCSVCKLITRLETVSMKSFIF